VDVVPETRSRLIPEPETKKAMLPTEGPGPRRATRHTYERTEVVHDLGGHASYAHLFKCEETGVLRRWGLETA
jgi:hypothetical protein